MRWLWLALVCLALAYEPPAGPEREPISRPFQAKPMRGDRSECDTQQSFVDRYQEWQDACPGHVRGPR